MLMNDLFDLYVKECLPQLQWRTQRDYRSIIDILRRAFGHKISTQSRFSAESSRALIRAIYFLSPFARGHDMPRCLIPSMFDPNSTPGERWRPIAGWERFYLVSDLGRIRSLQRPGGFLIGTTSPDGYRLLRLRDNGRKANVGIHRLVLEAFVGPCPEGHHACHNNGVPDDNRLINLRWGSISSNMQDRKKHGTDNWFGRAPSRCLQ